MTNKSLNDNDYVANARWIARHLFCRCAAAKSLGLKLHKINPQKPSVRKNSWFHLRLRGITKRWIVCCDGLSVHRRDGPSKSMAKYSTVLRQLSRSSQPSSAKKDDLTRRPRRIVRRRFSTTAGAPADPRLQFDRGANAHDFRRRTSPINRRTSQRGSASAGRCRRNATSNAVSQRLDKSAPAGGVYLSPSMIGVSNQTDNYPRSCTRGPFDSSMMKL